MPPPNSIYFLLIFIIILIASSAVGQKEKDEDQLKNERPNNTPQIPVGGKKLYNDSEVDPEWQFKMIHNLRWDLSKAFLAVSYLNLESQTMPDPDETGPDSLFLNIFKKKNVTVIGPHYYPQTKMSFFYGIDQPNMLIRFNQTENGAAFCEFGQIKDSVLHKNQTQLNNWKWDNCRYERRPIYKNEEKKKMMKHFYAFCPIHSADDGSDVFTWRLANGTYNPPSKSPQCLYDFHLKATETEEYDLLKYCSKAYFFNGLDYNVPNKRMRNRRKDWLLYLAEGQLKCSISEDIKMNMDLVEMGYSVKLVQYSVERRMSKFSRICPILNATLVEYKDKMKEGKFFIAAIIGGAQLDGEIRYPFPEEIPKFWDKNTYFEKFKYMNFDDKLCYLYYHALQRDLKTNKYNLQLEISHYCTERGMRGHLKFAIPIGPDQVPDGIFEDTGIQIDLDKGQMLRNTGQIIEEVKLLDGTKKKETQFAQNSAQDTYETEGNVFQLMNSSSDSDGMIEYDVPEDGNCTHSSQCKYGSRCGNFWQQEFCSKMTKEEMTTTAFKHELPEEWERAIKACCKQLKKERYAFRWDCDYIRRCKMATNNSPTRDGSGPDKRGISCQRDFECRFDEICDITSGECRKVNFLMNGEQCYVNLECYPNSECIVKEGLNNYGLCINSIEYNQAAEEPNDPLD